MEPMSDLMMWNMIVGFVSATVVLPIIQQPRWSTRARAGVTFVYSVVVGAVTTYLDGSLQVLDNPKAITTSIMTLLVTAIATYNGFAKPAGIAPAIEAATSSSGKATTPRRRTT